ncbi:MAG: DUF3853 family protein [Bacteroidetes bacterium]|nr:DUF3853 family protein [Bacteroidota bacterium]
MKKHMQNENIPIWQLSVEELQKMIETVVYKAMSGKEKVVQIKKEIELLSRKAVAKTFGISLVTLNKWKKLGLLPKPIKQGGKVLFVKSEIEDLILKGRL